MERVVGDWLFTDSTGTSGVFIDFKADGTYAGGQIVETSASSADTEVEDGNWVATDTTITSTPTKWSCPGPDSVSTVTYSFSAANLVVSDPSGLITFAPNDSASSSQTITLQTGCFDSNGNFTAAPVAPVTN
jgi:hypothetical protein